MKATLRLLIAAAVLVSAQVSFANSDAGSTTPGCPNKPGGQLVKVNYEPPAHPAPATAPGSGSSV